MPLRNAIPFKFKPRGVVDSWDGTNSIPGGMSSLQNLIPDPSTPSAFVCRPAVNTLSVFAGFSSVGTISAAYQINNRVYGLVSSSRNAGKDEPFSYNLTNGTFDTIQGITSTNVPTTQATTGDWVPPSSAASGPFIVFTHPGFNGTNGYFGYFDISGFTNTANGNITSGSNIVTGAFSILGVQPGYKISGTGIPANTRVTNVANVTETTTGSTNSNTSLTNVVALIPVGQSITGNGIPAGTTVTAVSGSAGNYTLTISQAATATATNVTLFGTGTTITMSANATATTNALSITVAGGTVSSPLWSSVNTSMNGLPSVPTTVQLFYSRLYFSCINVLYYTDTLSLNRTSASQQITAGDSTKITAQSLFTLTTTTQGILQGLLAFKANTVFQVTGDPALSNLTINSLNTAAGTDAPLSVVPTPSGVFFKAPDGIRIVQADGTVSEPNSDLRTPFINALYSSRISAAYNSNVYRVCLQNGLKAGTPWEEYWFDLSDQIWTGPHTFQQDLAVPWGSGFILFSHINPGQMFSSYVTQIVGSGFVENGGTMQWNFNTAPVGEVDSMMINTINETTLNLAFTAGSSPVTCFVADENGGNLSLGTIYPGGSSSQWGYMVWGSSIWGATQYGLRPYLIPWTNPSVFTKIVFGATGYSTGGFKISNIRFMLQPAMYLNFPQPNTTTFKPYSSINWDSGAVWDVTSNIWS